MASASSVVSSSGGEGKRSSSPGQRSQTSVDDPDSLDLTGPNPTRDALADGIVSLLSPTLKNLDEGVLSTKRSQEELSEQIALLTDQLKLISAEQLCPIDLDGYVTRLGNIKAKINIISSVLHAAQDRLNRVHEQAIKEASRRKPLLEPSPIPSPAASRQPGQPEIPSSIPKEGSSKLEVGTSGIKDTGDYDDSDSDS